jgi:2-haloacid dehalogenase
MNTVSRRQFITTTGLTLAGFLLSAHSSRAEAGGPKIKAIVFDGFPIFDPRPVFKKTHELFPEKGKQLTEIWRGKQFGYQWLRATGNKYKDFWKVTRDALVYAASECDMTLSESDLTTIMNEYRSINIWPDVKPALHQLKELGLTLGFLTNMTEEMIVRGIENSATGEYFTHIMSTDRIRTYKPAPAAYRMGTDTLKLRKEEILFVAFAGWDMAGAKWFGYPTYWVNRLKSPMDQLDAEPDGIGENLTELVEFVVKYNK